MLSQVQAIVNGALSAVPATADLLYLEYCLELCSQVRWPPPVSLVPGLMVPFLQPLHFQLLRSSESRTRLCLSPSPSFYTVQ